ncbi:MAG: hypothetical protein E7418_02440 [Ruminococcaceae bacterium]|nr:hypothetical protein [Oscillospiraceae bacterium]
MQKEILLLGKKINVEKSPVVLSYQPDENWQEVWRDTAGCWTYENGYLIGTEPANKGGILLSRERFEKDVMFSFTMASVLPATRDLNAVYCVTWDEENNYLKKGYISGLNGWYESKSGIERFPEDELRCLTSLYHYEPGTEVRITTGAVQGHNFLIVDDVLIQEVVDNMDPIVGGYVGFSPYSTKLKVKDIEVREVCWEEREQSYLPEF